MSEMMPMVMMMNMMKGKNGPNSRHQELLQVLNEQEERIRIMLEEQNNKKNKEAAKAKNHALIERLFQIEENLLNHEQERPGRNKTKKVDFVELMKGQQLYQKQLIDTLITINKKPKNTVQPTVYLPVPIRDPNLLPPEVYAPEESTKDIKKKPKKARPHTFGVQWEGQQNQLVGQPMQMSNSPILANSRPPSNTNPIVQASQTRISARQISGSGSSLRPQMVMSTLPPLGYNQQSMYPMQPMAGGSQVFGGMQGSVVGSTPNLGVPPEMQPNVLRIYKKKKSPDQMMVGNKGKKREGPYIISKLRKYAIAAHFIKKLWINQVKANVRYRREARLYFEENAERVYNKTVKFLRQSLSEELEKLWNLDMPLSITRRKKLYAMYQVETSTMGPVHWEQINLIILSLLEALNKYCNDNYLDPEIISFFARYSSNRAFLKENFYFDSMLDRLEFDNYEGLT